MATHTNLNMNASASSEVGGFRQDSSGNITHGKVGNRWVDIDTYNRIASGQDNAYATSAGFKPVAVEQVQGAPTGSRPAPMTQPQVTFTSVPSDPFFDSQDYRDFEAAEIQDAGQRADFIRANTKPDGTVDPRLMEQFAIGDATMIGNITTGGQVGVADAQRLVADLNADGSFAQPDSDLDGFITDFGETSDLGADELGALADATPPSTEPTFWQKMFGFYDKENRIMNRGFFEPVVGGALGVGKLALGYKQFKQAGEALDFQKDAFERNFAMQTEMINRRLEDRERARQLLQGNRKGADQAARDYVQKYGVKDKK